MGAIPPLEGHLPTLCGQSVLNRGAIYCNLDAKGFKEKRGEAWWAQVIHGIGL